MALSGATTPGQNRPGSIGNEGVFRIPQSSSITGTSPSDCLVSYPGHWLEKGSYSSAEVQLVYSTAPGIDRKVSRKILCYNAPQNCPKYFTFPRSYGTLFSPNK